MTSLGERAAKDSEMQKIKMEKEFMERDLHKTEASLKNEEHELSDERMKRTAVPLTQNLSTWAGSCF